MQYLQNVFHNGMILTLLVLFPNIIWMAFPPRDLPGRVETKPNRLQKVMAILEGSGRISVFTIPFFYQLNLTRPADWLAFLVGVAALFLYYLGWFRYYRNGRKYRFLFEPLFRIPIPMAVSPVLCFLAGAALLRSWPLLAGTLALGIGHLYLSCLEYQKLRINNEA